MRKIADALNGVSLLGFDSDCVIYFLDARAEYIARMKAVIGHITSGQMVGLTSVVTLSEGLFKPIQNNDVRLQKEYENFLLGSFDFQTIPVTPPIAIRAAELRVQYNLRTPDALQAATALESGCGAFLTNNGKHFRRVTSLPVLVLDELEL